MIVNDKSDNPERFFVIQRRFRPPSKIPCWLLAPRLGFSARRLRLILSLFLSFSLFLSLSLSFSLFLSLSLSFSLSLSLSFSLFLSLSFSLPPCLYLFASVSSAPARWSKFPSLIFNAIHFVVDEDRGEGKERERRRRRRGMLDADWDSRLFFTDIHWDSLPRSAVKILLVLIGDSRPFPSSDPNAIHRQRGRHCALIRIFEFDANALVKSY